MYFSTFAILVGTVTASLPKNSCSAADKLIWKGNAGFSQDISRFAVASREKASGVAAKLVAAYPGLGPSCSDCFGEAVACGTSNCFFDCFRSSTSADCVSCSDRWCTPRLKDCVGVSNNEDLPPKPLAEGAAGPTPPPSTTLKPKSHKSGKTRKLLENTEDDEDFLNIVEIVFGVGSSNPSADDGYDADSESESVTLAV